MTQPRLLGLALTVAALGLVMQGRAFALCAASNTYVLDVGGVGFSLTGPRPGAEKPPLPYGVFFAEESPAANSSEICFRFVAAGDAIAFPNGSNWAHATFKLRNGTTVGASCNIAGQATIWMDVDGGANPCPDSAALRPDRTTAEAADYAFTGTLPFAPSATARANISKSFTYLVGVHALDCAHDDQGCVSRTAFGNPTARGFASVHD